MLCLTFAVQQSDSVIHIYILFHISFFSIMVYHSILNIVPCEVVFFTRLGGRCKGLRRKNGDFFVCSSPHDLGLTLG